MSFQGYLDNIQSKTGRTAADFRALADKKGFTANGRLLPATKPADIVAWLKQEFDLGHGHAMAIFALLKGSKAEGGR